MEFALPHFHIRPLQSDDSLDDLTSLLHRAFSPMGREGISCTSFNQSVEVTQFRVHLGACFVALDSGRIAGTLTLHQPEQRSECRWYRQADVASVHQFAVDPAYQGTGCGKALLRFATSWAREHDFHELALDTPLPASHLIAFYALQGFREVEQAQFSGRAYRSCVLSKTVNRTAAEHKPSPMHHYRQPQPLFGSLV